MEAWQKSLQQSITTPEQLNQYFPVDIPALERVTARFSMQITPYYLGLIREPGDAIWRQCVPDESELVDDGLLLDPLHEEALSPVPGVVHRYPDRVLFLVAGTCAVYCRFCTRKRRVGCSDGRVTFNDVRNGIDYIAATPSIREVILSGGDPLLMHDMLLKDMLDRLRAIPHVEIIRLHTRLPVTLPERITEKLCALLRRYQPLFLNTHFNHPRELTREAAEACAMLADSGIPLGNQTVLMKGVNDRAEILAELFRCLLQMRVRPYYLHHLDLCAGTSHFRTSIEAGLQIMAQLRGQVSGMAIPQYVVDLPGGRGKIPLVPDAIVNLGPQARLRSAGGEIVTIPNQG